MKLKASTMILMMMTLAFALGLQACAPKGNEDCGFVQNVYGERISWKNQIPVVMYLHDSVPTDSVPALISAVKTWNEAAGKTLVQLVTDRRVNTEAAQRDRLNVISFSSQWESDRHSEQARTSVHWVGDLIQEADIKINGARKADGNPVFNYYWDRPSSGGVNLEALVLHEIGHVLGMKHKDYDNSVMQTYLASNSDRVDLTQTDRDSLSCEY